jgi:hypothetical protein
MGPAEIADIAERLSHHRWLYMGSPKARNDTKFESKLYKKKNMKNTHGVCVGLCESKNTGFSSLKNKECCG